VARLIAVIATICMTTPFPENDRRGLCSYL
jgi:hypothetical protein